MANGIIVKWINTYGFIRDDEDDGIFFHLSECHGSQNKIDKGVTVEFDKVPSRKKRGKYDAKNVKIITDPLSQHSGNEENLEFQSFHNPYTFVPTPPRNRINSGNFAGDFDPVKVGLTHECLRDNLWTGQLPIKVTVVTPLVTPLVLLNEETKKSAPNSSKHHIYDVLDFLPGSSFHGMFRSAYEIITNSRYSCFRNSNRLAYRMNTGEALKLIPAIIEKTNEKLAARLYPGTSTPTEKGPQTGDPVYGAMLSLYYGNSRRLENTQVLSGYTPKTGDKVWAEIVLCQHEVSQRGITTWKNDYKFWKVVHVWPFQPKTTTPTPIKRKAWPTIKPQTSEEKRQTFYKPVNSITPEIQVVEGYVFISNENMGKKHDERVFFGPNAESFDILENLKEAWRMRIQSYREAHSNEDIYERPKNSDMAKPWENLGNKPGKTAWSPHLYQDGNYPNRWGKSIHDAIELKAGDMVYVRCNYDRKGEIEGIMDIFPVMISRELYKKSPEDLLPTSLQPAKEIHELSPADRLFGWVALGKTEEAENSAYRGRIRVVCEDSSRPEVIEHFNGTLPLTILGEPKPAQGRFYVAQTPEGKPQGDWGAKSGKGYAGGKGLRGRKQYWHHRGLEASVAEEYWKPTPEDRTQKKSNGRYQEFRRPDKDGSLQQDSQNCSIKSWIKPGTVFGVTLHLHNLQSEEIGALLWLLTLSEDHYYRLGYGKPLGFGSVRLKIDEDRMVDGALTLAQGKEWQKYYGSLDAHLPATLKKEKYEELINRFRSSMVADNSLPENHEKSSVCTQHCQAELKKSLPKENLEKQNFERLPFIQGFLRVLQGPAKDMPIHYPRLKPKPHWKGENFKWFGKNEKSLPYVLDDEDLPY